MVHFEFQSIQALDTSGLWFHDLYFIKLQTTQFDEYMAHTMRLIACGMPIFLPESVERLS
jgi:hypothetical protein